MKKAKFSSNFTQNGANLMGDPICTAFPFINDNQFIFFDEALRNSAKSMENRPLNFMHDQEHIVGHVTKAWVDNKEVKYNNNPINCQTLASTMVFYELIFPEMFDKIKNGQADDRFKLSVEVQFKDLQWALYDKNDPSGTVEYFDEGSNEDLDWMGFWGMFMGTFNGLEYNGKAMACAMASKSKELNFTGLALTDELNGAAADQNADLTVLGTFATTRKAFATGRIGSIQMNNAMSDVVSGKTIGDIVEKYNISISTISDMISKAREMSKRRLGKLSDVKTHTVEDESVKTGLELLYNVKAMFADQVDINEQGLFVVKSLARDMLTSDNTEIGADHNDDAIVISTGSTLHATIEGWDVRGAIESLSQRIDQSIAYSKLVDEHGIVAKKVDDLTARNIEIEKERDAFKTDNSRMAKLISQHDDEIAKMSNVAVELQKTIDSMCKVVKEQGDVCVERFKVIESLQDELGRLRGFELFELGLSASASAMGNLLKTMTTVEFDARKRELMSLAGIKSVANVLVGSENKEDKKLYFEKLAEKNKS